MARIKIKDLPKDMKISAEEMRRIHAGFGADPTDHSLSTRLYIIGPTPGLPGPISCPPLDPPVVVKVSEADGSIANYKLKGRAC